MYIHINPCIHSYIPKCKHMHTSTHGCTVYKDTQTNTVYCYCHVFNTSDISILENLNIHYFIFSSSILSSRTLHKSSSQQAINISQCSSPMNSNWCPSQISSSQCSTQIRTSWCSTPINNTQCSSPISKINPTQISCSNSSQCSSPINNSQCSTPISKILCPVPISTHSQCSSPISNS